MVKYKTSSTRIVESKEKISFEIYFLKIRKLYLKKIHML